MLAALSVLVLAGAPPAPLTDQRLATIIEEIRVRNGVPALAAAVVYQGKIVAQATVGFRKAGDPTKVAADDRFHIGSVTKSMTSTMLASLVRYGKLSWNTTPYDVFPEYRPTMNPAFKKVTLRHLVTHWSGIAPTSPWVAGSFEEQAKDERAARHKFVGIVLANPPVSEPGTKHQYSNNGYIVAGAMAEKVTGKTWAELMEAQVFRPFGMKTVGYGPMGTPGKVDQPWQHVFRDGKAEPKENVPGMDNPPDLTPAGRVHCSIGDLAKYVNAHLQGRAGKSKALPKEIADLLHTPQFGGGYAFGWSILDRPWGKGKVVFHNGSNNMNYAAVWMAPAREFGAMAATNIAGAPASKAVDEAVSACIREVLPK